MINFYEVDFSERRSEEVISFFWRSVYMYQRIGLHVWFLMICVQGLQLTYKGTTYKGFENLEISGCWCHPVWCLTYVLFLHNMQKYLRTFFRMVNKTTTMILTSSWCLQPLFAGLRLVTYRGIPDPSSWPLDPCLLLQVLVDINRLIKVVVRHVCRAARGWEIVWEIPGAMRAGHALLGNNLGGGEGRRMRMK